MSSSRPEDDETNFSDHSDSEEDYNETEKQLLRKVKNRINEYSDSEEEVFNVGSNDVDEEDDYNDDKSDLALSDIEGHNDDDLPDVRAWGKEKRKYYSTDYVDPDYGGFQGKDAHLAELEEEEARNLQKQLAQQLDDDDFSLEVFTQKSQEEKIQVEEVIKTDISKLSKRQRLQILQRESPEFFGLIQDFEAKMSIARDYLSPVLTQYKKKQISLCNAVGFVQTQYELILNYCVNIYMYLLLKASKVNIQNHPVIKRLYQYRQLLSELDPVFEGIIKPQIDIILKEMHTEKEALENKTDKKNVLKLLESLTKKTESSKKKRVLFQKTQPSKKIKISDEDSKELEEMQADDVVEEENEIYQENEDLIKKRAITYEMAKNKGLTPHRKKEQRNPRVKHKLKFRKALVRRKGAVREPRKELTKYSGEISGINAYVSKSIKIKT